jgi:two-component system cell cycle sensor histidine kinase/response regulator CckA
MVLGIVQQHQGWIECHSIFGEGTCFDIYLPGQSAPIREAPPVTRPRPARGNERVLLVDDEEPLRLLGRAILQKHGYHVLLAVDGVQAVEMFQRERVDLVVLDLTMPRLSGRDALKQFLQIDPAACILFASGYNPEHLSPAEHEQVYGFVSKPYRPEDLAAAVRAALDRKRQNGRTAPVGAFAAGNSSAI